MGNLHIKISKNSSSKYIKNQMVEKSSADILRKERALCDGQGRVQSVGGASPGASPETPVRLGIRWTAVVRCRARPIGEKVRSPQRGWAEAAAMPVSRLPGGHPGRYLGYTGNSPPSYFPLVSAQEVDLPK